MSVNVSVKWGTNSFKDVCLNVNEPLDLFKAQLQSLTNVDPSRQKIMFKGMLLKDDADLSKLSISDGQTILMMGTPDSQLAAQEAQIKEEEKVKAQDASAALNVINVPCGLVNLGNTCYLNASFQCLSHVQELAKSIMDLQPDRQHPQLLTEFSKAIKAINGDRSTFTPNSLIKSLRATFPQFDERGEHGLPSQQDAEECYSQMISFIKANTPDDGKLVEDLFSIKLSKSTKCDIHPDETIAQSSDTVAKLNCHISQSTNHLVAGLTDSLVQQLEMSCPGSNDLVSHTCTSKITRLPPYLTVHFIRFFWKRVEKVKAKILRKVSFPMILDMYPLCDDSLKAQLKPVRGNSEPKSTKLPWEGDDKCQVTGYYELFALLTHAGRSADAGHYIGWVKDDQLENTWWKFDDDVVTRVKDDDILRLDGGGDWHMAYICLYRAIWVPKLTL